MTDTLFLLLNIITILLLLLLFVAIVWLSLRRASSPNLDPELIRKLEQSLTESARLQGEMSALRQQMESVSTQVNNGLKGVGDQVKVFGEVQTKLGELTKATEQVYNVGKDISGLNEILRAPKLRGGFGELLLNDLLGKVIPNEYFEIQYKFAGGETVDAIIKLNSRLVPVDSKFPLENFRKYVGADESDKTKLRREFERDVRRHIDAIAMKYIRPDEGTLDFALMYIPAENVYYEIAVTDESALMEYALSKRVVPVSPNTFYAYLNVILLGLRGLRIEQRAKEMLDHLSRLQTEFDQLRDDFDTMGKHLDSASKKYQEAQRRVEEFAGRLDKLKTE
jgi:DNA recombination protein RmuC